MINLEKLETTIKDILDKAEIESKLGYSNSNLARSIVKKALKDSIKSYNKEGWKDYLEYHYGDID